MTDAAEPPSLRPPRHALDRRAVMLWRVQGAASSLPLLAGVAGVTVAFEQVRPYGWFVLVVAMVWALVQVLVVPPWRHRIHRWEVTDEAVYAASGWWTHEWRIAPVSRIQTVDTIQGPMQRRFRLASVVVTTASAAGAILLEGLDEELARGLVQRLTEVTHATPGDAT